MSVGLAIAIAVCLVALAWKGYHLYLAPWDRALWVVVFAVGWLLVCLALVATPDVVRAVLGNGGTLLLQTFAGQGFALLLLAFLSFADRSRQHRNARFVAWQLVPFGLVALSMTVLLLSLPPALQAQEYVTARTDVGAITAFYVIGNLYLFYAVLVGAVLAADVARRSDPRTRRGLGVAAIGLVLASVSGALRALSIVLRALERSPVLVDGAVRVLLPLGLVLFCGGAVAPGVATRTAAVRRWRWHRRVYRDLEPLWSRLTAVFPDGELGRHPDTGTSRRSRVHRRCSRRVIECRDGLVRISPHLRELGVADGESEPSVLVPALCTALDEHAAGREVEGSAIRVAPPASPSLDDDIRRLVSVSRAMPPAATTRGAR